jgi:hypothetical protein
MINIDARHLLRAEGDKKSKIEVKKFALLATFLLVGMVVTTLAVQYFCASMPFFSM